MIKQKMKIKIPIGMMTLVLVMIYLPLDIKEIISSNNFMYELFVSLLTLSILGTVLGVILSRYFFYEIGISYLNIYYGPWRSFYVLTENDVIEFSAKKISILLTDHKRVIVLRNELNKNSMSKLAAIVRNSDELTLSKKIIVKID